MIIMTYWLVNIRYHDDCKLEKNKLFLTKEMADLFTSKIKKNSVYITVEEIPVSEEKDNISSETFEEVRDFVSYPYQSKCEGCYGDIYLDDTGGYCKTCRYNFGNCPDCEFELEMIAWMTFNNTIVKEPYDHTHKFAKSLKSKLWKCNVCDKLFKGNK